MRKIILMLLIFAFIFVSGCNLKNNTPITIKITSTPSNAMVYVDGSFKGETPLTIDNISKGNHRVVVEKANYLAVRDNIKVEKEDTFNFNLVPPPLFFEGDYSNIYDTVIEQNKLYIVNIALKEANVHCIDLGQKKEIWKYKIEGINNISNFKVIDNIIYISIYDEKHRYYVLYTIDGERQLLNKETFPAVTGGKIGEDIVINYSFDFFNPAALDNFITAYSLKQHKIIWEKDIKEKEPIVVLGPFNNYVCAFGISNSYLKIFKIDKTTGETILQKVFPEISNFGESEGEKIIPSPIGNIGKKIFFAPDEREIYCVDLDRMEILYKCDPGIYFHLAAIKDNLLFVSGSGKSVAIDINSGKIKGTFDVQFSAINSAISARKVSAISTVNGKVFIGVSGDKIHSFDKNGKELPFPYSPDMLGGSFSDFETSNNILLVSATNRITGEPINYLYAFDTETFEPLFIIRGEDGDQELSFRIYSDLLFIISRNIGGPRHGKDKVMIIDLKVFK